MSKLDDFLAGERLDDVAIFLTHDFLDSQGKIANMGEAVEDGVVLVVPGEEGRKAFASGTGMDPMEFARRAMDGEGEIEHDLTGGQCAEDEEVELIFAFAEERNEDVGGLYAEGDVMHAYAQCSGGHSFSEKWVLGEPDADGDERSD